MNAKGSGKSTIVQFFSEEKVATEAPERTTGCNVSFMVCCVGRCKMLVALSFSPLRLSLLCQFVWQYAQPREYQHHHSHQYHHPHAPFFVEFWDVGGDPRMADSTSVFFADYDGAANSFIPLVSLEMLLRHCVVCV